MSNPNPSPETRIKKGEVRNPNGRPKGQTLKEYWRARFKDMSDEEKLEFTKRVGNENIWKMAEGNPQQETDITSGGKELEALTVIKNANDKPIELAN